jgi:hypothetical protein
MLIAGIAAAGQAKPATKANRPHAEPLQPFLLTMQEPDSGAAPGSFAIAVLPDTQMYTAAKGGAQPDMLVAQAEWIISNRVSRNIVFATTEGDISNDGNRIIAQWERATNALYRLEDPIRTQLPDGIPYSAVVGNHDTYGGGTIKFNDYFGTNRFAGRAYYGGNYSTNNSSHYDVFSAGGQDFVVLSLAMAAGGDSNLMRWANSVLQSNATRQAIVVTHSLINPAPWPTPGTWTPEGEPIFNALTNNANMFLMLCGHRHGQGRRHEPVGDGRWVDVLLSDYQSYTNGGNGFMRLMEFSPAGRSICVKTFSPWTEEWATNSDSFFTLTWPVANK